jgi:hypothetical protein
VQLPIPANIRPAWTVMLVTRVQFLISSRTGAVAGPGSQPGGEKNRRIEVHRRSPSYRNTSPRGIVPP